MDHAIDMGPANWKDWQQTFPHADDDTRLAALRNYIEQAAREAHNDDPSRVTAEWANKKLAVLGVSARIDAVNTYTMKVPVSGDFITQVSARNRAEAERLFLATVGSTVRTTDPVVTGAVEFTDGPDDFAPGALPDDAPTTVDATLVKLRETILLGVVAGPRFCVPGANEVLAAFDLGDVPARKHFKVTRPVAGFAETTVEAYDEASAERVAGWRWDNGHTAYTVRADDLADAGAPVVAEV